jgi:hypothetical protein
MSNADGYALDWDSEIKNDGESFSLLPDGCEADFTILEVGRARVANGKYAGSPMAKIKVKATYKGESTTINENLILHSKMEWKLCQFFTAIGQRKHGDPLCPRWNEVPGSFGKLKVKIEKYTVTNKDGIQEERESNKVDKWLEPIVVKEPDDSDF